VRISIPKILVAIEEAKGGSCVLVECEIFRPDSTRY